MENFMPICRRKSNSFIVRHVWRAIEHIHGQQQLANFERIYQYMDNVQKMSKDELQIQLNYCLLDGLLILVKSGRVKGYMKLKTLEGYELPTILERDTHDWYCFECHLSGEVISCLSCFRVYHISCASSCKTIDNRFLCNICHISNNVTTEMLNVTRLKNLLSYVFKNLEKWLPASAVQRSSSVSESLLIKYLIYTQMDLGILREKLSNFQYSNVEQFQADLLTILHNVVIYEGEHSTLTLRVRETINFCIKDVREIKLCADCFQRSYEKNDEMWFCKPCNPPHELVYAQAKGYPFWPAKVIEKHDDKYDVRFFGCFHQRATIHHDHIRPITVNIENIQKISKRASWQRASEELELHLKLLEEGVDKNFNVLPRHTELVKTRVKKTKKTKQKIKKKMTAGISKPKNKPLLFSCSSMKTENSKNIKSMHKSHFAKKRNGQKKTNFQDLVNIEDSGGNTNAVNVPSQASVSTQTHCLSHHKHHKYVLNLDEKDIKQVKNSDYTQIVKYVMNQPKKKLEESSHPDLHAFCNKYCPLNQYRKNIFPDVEVEVDMREAKEVATNLVNEKYNEIIDNLAKSHLKAIAEIFKKIWCVVCFQEANIHCCWNVDYCSQKCQNEHWENGHKLKHKLRSDI